MAGITRTSDMQTDFILMAENEEELKSFLMRVKEESKKADSKLNIQKLRREGGGKKKKLRSWHPVPSLHEEKVEAVTDFTFLGSKITADGECSHEIKRHFLLGRKAMTNLDSILKTRDITLPTKVHIVKDMVFPVVMYGCESWTIKKAAAAAAKSLQSCPTLCDPINGSPPGSPIPGILPARTLEWVAISFSNA